MSAEQSIDEIKSALRNLGSLYKDRLDRLRRIYVENRSYALASNREVEFLIKRDVAKYFGIGHTDICFCGSAQLGFSVHKDRLFEPRKSDLDIACVSTSLFQAAWIDVIDTTKAFSDNTVFAGTKKADVETFKDQILRRGMIRVATMPRSNLSIRWRSFEDSLSRKHNTIFGSASIAIYMNEYAFCWKQDSALSQIMEK